MLLEDHSRNNPKQEYRYSTYSLHFDTKPRCPVEKFDHQPLEFETISYDDIDQNKLNYQHNIIL